MSRNNALGFRLTTFVVREKDGTERVVKGPEQPLQREVGWFLASVKSCRGWMNPGDRASLARRGEGLPAEPSGR